MAHDGAPQRDTLALATGELPGAALQQVVDGEKARGLLDLGADGGAPLRRSRHQAADEGRALEGSEPAHDQWQRHVLLHRHVRIERVVLEHHGDVAVGGAAAGNIGAGDGDGPAVGAFEARDDAEQGGLATAGRADKGDEGSRVEGERHALEDTRLAK